MDVDKILFEDILEYRPAVTKAKDWQPIKDFINNIQGGFEPEENKGDDEMNLADKVKKAKRESDRISCEYMDQPVDVFSGNIAVDEKTTTIKNATLQTEGWSLNGMGFSTNYLNTLVNKINERPKMFVGHAVPAGDKDVAGQLRRMDRPASEWAATIRNARVEVSKEGKYKGLNQVKGDLEFTEMDIGQQLFRQAKKDPGSVRISTNVRGMFKEDTELHNRKGDVMDECVLCYSTDFVSYDAAGGGILDSMNSESDEKIDLQAVSKKLGLSLVETMCMVGGVYNNEIETPVSPPPEPSPKEDDFKLSSDITNAFESLKTRMKQQDVRERFFEIKRFYSDILREIIIDKGNDYPKEADKKMAFDMASKQLKEVVFDLDLKALKKSIEPFSSIKEYFNNNKTMKGVEKVMKYEFESIEDVMQNPDVSNAIAAAIPEAKVDDPFNKGQKVTVKSLLETASDVDALEVLLPGSDSKVTVGQLKSDFAKLTAAKAVADREASFTELTKKHGISNDLIDDDWKASVLAEASAEKREEMVKNKKSYLERIVKAGIETALKSSSQEDTKKTENGEWIQSLVDSAKKGDTENVDPVKVKADAWNEYETTPKS